jgi:hypothetical protein
VGPVALRTRLATGVPLSSTKADIPLIGTSAGLLNPTVYPLDAATNTAGLRAIVDNDDETETRPVATEVPHHSIPRSGALLGARRQLEALPGRFEDAPDRRAGVAARPL